jgi:hypothetical protein
MAMGGIESNPRFDARKIDSANRAPVEWLDGQ